MAAIVVLLVMSPGVAHNAAARGLQATGDNSTLSDQSPNPTVDIGESFQIFFSLINSGSTTWTPDHYWLQNEENPMGAAVKQPLSGAVIPGGISVWYINLKTPSSPGVYRTSWMVSHDDVDFGAFVYVEVTVRPPSVEVKIGGSSMGLYSIPSHTALRVNYAGMDGGPLVVINHDGRPTIAALRDAWFPPGQGIATSFVQLMGLPAGQLSSKYVFPAYNNVTLNEQLRFGNVGGADTTVTVTIGGVLQGSYFLHPNEQVRVNYAGLDSGPVVVESSDSVPIIAAIRGAWGNPVTSWAQVMGLPAGQLSDTYYFPAYNNVTLNEQLRFGNVGSSDTTVTVTIGGVLQGSYDLAPSEQMRVNYAGLDSGPVVVQSSDSVPIIAALRDAWFPPGQGIATSFVQLMGLPASLVSDEYIFPAYNNVTLNEQLRFGNVGGADTTVTVTIGGVLQGSYFLHPNEQVRVNYAGLDSGPVVVESSGSVPIIAAIRGAWGNPVTSWAQLMGLPAGQLSDTYYFPAYNNITLNEQLRFGVP